MLSLGISPAKSADITDFMRYFDLYGKPNASNDLTLEKVKAKFRPYRYGYITELNVTGPGQYSVTKHYAMGRASHELAYCLLDRRTCFLTGKAIETRNSHEPGGEHMFWAGGDSGSGCR